MSKHLIDMTFSYFVAFTLSIKHQSSSRFAKHVRFASKINIILENELNSNFIENLRDIVDDFQYHFNNFKIRENTLKKRQIFFQKNQ